MRLQHLTLAGRSVSPRLVIAVLVIAFLAIVTAVAILAASGRSPTPPRPAAAPLANASPSPAMTTAAPTASPSPAVSIEPAKPKKVKDPVLGTDGRLTVLLLGSDYRPSLAGNRTDVIMVVSIDPATGAV